MLLATGTCCSEVHCLCTWRLNSTGRASGSSTDEPNSFIPQGAERGASSLNAELISAGFPSFERQRSFYSLYCFYAMNEIPPSQLNNLSSDLKGVHPSHAAAVSSCKEGPPQFFLLPFSQTTRSPPQDRDRPIIEKVCALQSWEVQLKEQTRQPVPHHPRFDFSSRAQADPRVSSCAIQAASQWAARPPHE